MSMFENPEYRWRETYFVFFVQDNRPSAEAIRDALEGLDASYQIADVHGDELGEFESLTLTSPVDFSAMDITFLSGEEVREHIVEVMEELEELGVGSDEKQKLAELPDLDARFDIYHFEKVMDDGGEDEFLDPGSLLIVLERLAELCQGVGVDPQSGAVL